MSEPPSEPYELQERDILYSSNSRYLVMEFSGEGYFGRVAKCLNLMTGKKVAVKIHKENDEYEDSGPNELEMLEQIRTLDPDESNIVAFFEAFSFKNLSCLTFEMLDKSLLEVMMEQQRTRNLNEIRAITQQLLVAFDALKNLGVIHLDLKPDNIMFVNTEDHPSKVKLIDFGLAQRVGEVNTEKIIQPLSYQAPEVNLGLPLSEAMDMWGVGCVMAFMYFGAHLLPYQCHYDWMRTIVHLVGQPEDNVLNAAKNSSTFFSKEDDLTGWRLMSPEEYEDETGCQAVIGPVNFDNKNLDDAVQSFQEHTTDAEYKDRMAFLSLLKACFNLDPQARITPREAMMNPFISMVDPVDVMATSTHADEVIQMMNYSHPEHLIESDDSFSDGDMDSYSSSAEQADIESNDDTDLQDNSSDNEQAETDISSDSCISEDTLSGYDADCSVDSSTGEDPHTSADIANVESSADEYVIRPSGMRCFESLAFTDEHSDLSYKESGAAPTKIDEVAVCGPVEDNVPAGVDPINDAAANISTIDEAAANISLNDEAPANISTIDEAPANISTIDEAPTNISTIDGAAANISLNDEAAANISLNDEAAANISLNDGAPANISTSDGAPANISTIDEAPANISTIDEAPTNVSLNDEALANISTSDGAPTNISTSDGAPAATQPAVQKKFRNIRKFFSRIRRRVVSYFRN